MAFFLSMYTFYYSSAQGKKTDEKETERVYFFVIQRSCELLGPYHSLAVRTTNHRKVNGHLTHALEKKCRDDYYDDELAAA